jgi:hypothetical protein
MRNQASLAELAHQSAHLIRTQPRWNKDAVVHDLRAWFLLAMEYTAPEVLADLRDSWPGYRRVAPVGTFGGERHVAHFPLPGWPPGLRRALAAWAIRHNLIWRARPAAWVLLQATQTLDEWTLHPRMAGAQPLGWGSIGGYVPCDLSHPDEKQRQFGMHKLPSKELLCILKSEGICDPGPDASDQERNAWRRSLDAAMTIQVEPIERGLCCTREEFHRRVNGVIKNIREQEAAIERRVAALPHARWTYPAYFEWVVLHQIRRMSCQEISERYHAAQETVRDPRTGKWRWRISPARRSKIITATKVTTTVNTRTGQPTCAGRAGSRSPTSRWPDGH